MANIRTFYLPHYPDYPVYVALFKHVSNAAFLRSQLLAANPEFDYAFLDATMILSPQHLLSASFLALHLHLTSRSKSRTPHSELVFRLHPNNNIGESYQKFGISDASSTIIAVKFGNLPPTTEGEGEQGGGSTGGFTAENVAKHLGEHIKGESVQIGEDGEEVGAFVDIEKVRKVYKLSALGKPPSGGKKAVVNGDAEVVDEKKELESVILGIMTIKGS